MTAKQIYVAFPASQTLHERTQAFIKAVQDKPSQDHQALLSAIPTPFIDEVLAAFFAGPVDATGMTGSTASVIHGLMNMVGKASRALANKVLGKVTIEEQKVLARHFVSLTHEKDGQPYTGYLMDPELANEALLMFESFRTGDGDREHLIRIMSAMADGTIREFFDKPMSMVKVGMVTRGLISAGRATIEKASHSMNGKILPDLEPDVRQRVLAYMESLLVEL